MAKLLFTTFNFKLLRPTQKLEPVLTCLRRYSVKPSKLRNNFNSIVDENLYKRRRLWNEHDTDSLLKLYEEHGPKWKSFMNYFPGRTACDIRAHYFMKQDYYRWTQEEKIIMQDLLGEETSFENIDWEHVQKSLPQRKSMYFIQKYYRNSIDPSLNRGVWTEEEITQLLVLVGKHGEDWKLISEKMGTRSIENCRVKYRYTLNTRNVKTGNFSKEEDKALLDAVNKYGTESFHKIKEETNSRRTAIQLKYRYKYNLDPAIDKSPWTQEEKEQLYKLYTELKDAKLVKKKMNSKRSIRDLHNHLRPLKKRIKEGLV